MRYIKPIFVMFAVMFLLVTPASAAVFDLPAFVITIVDKILVILLSLVALVILNDLFELGKKHFMKNQSAETRTEEAEGATSFLSEVWTTWSRRLLIIAFMLFLLWSVFGFKPDLSDLF